jgi:hypothetical protein
MFLYARETLNPAKDLEPMPYEIKESPELFEVLLFGPSSKWEVLLIVKHLHVKDPRKERRDLWILSAETSIPYAAFQEISQNVGRLCRDDFVGEKTAIVAAHEMQLQEAELYRFEALALPFEIRVFRSREEALTWFQS